MYCHNCGKEIVGAGIYCQSCGAKQQDVSEQTNDKVVSDQRSSLPTKSAKMLPQKQKISSKTLKIVALIIAVAVVISGVIILIVNVLPEPHKELSVAELLDLGEKYLLELNYEQALVQFLAVIEIEPRNARAYIGAAEAYIGTGDIDSAIDILRRGLVALPGNTEIQTFLHSMLLPSPEPTPEPTTEPTAGTTDIDQPVNLPSQSEIARAYLQILKNEGVPVYNNWGSIANGVISVSITDLDEDGVHELIYSRIRDYLVDVYVYCFNEQNCVMLLEIKDIVFPDDGFDLSNFRVYQLVNSGVMVLYRETLESALSRDYYIFHDFDLAPTKRNFLRELDYSSSDWFYYIDGDAVTKNYYDDEQNRLLSERVYCLTGEYSHESFDHPRLPQDNELYDLTGIEHTHMTYEEAIAFLMDIIEKS